jgi:glycosyltransferase involved in cell wall biosynthesis
VILATETPKLIKLDATAKSEPFVVVGIPAFNEEKTIARVVVGALKYANAVVVCDDGSSDLTGEIALRLGALVVRHERNSGYGATIQSLFTHAKELNADVLVTLDADGQHEPAEIPSLVKPISEGNAEVVLGSRFLGERGSADMPYYRKVGVKLITSLSNGSGEVRVSDAQSGFRAYSKSALEQLSIHETGMSASVELLREGKKLGLKFCEIPITCKYADSVGAETSSEHPVSHGFGIFTSLVKMIVEDRPLAYLGIPGVISIALGVFFGVWMMNIYVIEHRIVTNIALACIAFVLFGLFLIFTSITLYAIKQVSDKFGKRP